MRIEGLATKQQVNSIEQQITEHNDQIKGLATKQQVNSIEQQITEHNDQIEGLATTNHVNSIKKQLASILDVIAVSESSARPLFVTTTLGGLFVGKPGDYISDRVLEGNIWDAHIASVARVTALARPGVAIDVGAHFGTVTLALAELFESVLAFEPNEFNFAILRSNVMINGLTNVQIFNHGLYSRPVFLSLGNRTRQEVEAHLHEDGRFDGHRSHNLGAYFFEEGGSEGVFSHPAKTLDSLALSNVSFLKIDVQGADGEVLFGAIETIKANRPTIVFEWEQNLSRHFSVPFADLASLFADLDYELTPLKFHNEKQVDYLARPLVRG